MSTLVLMASLLLGSAFASQPETVIITSENKVVLKHQGIVNDRGTLETAQAAIDQTGDYSQKENVESYSLGSFRQPHEQPGNQGEKSAGQ